MPRKRVIFRMVLFAAIAFALVMALLPHPPHTPMEHHDKFQHMTAFTTIALLAAWSYPDAPLFRIGERLSFMGALIEVLQAMPAIHRDCDIRDWIADTFAVAGVLSIIALIRARAATSSRDAAPASPAASAVHATADRIPLA